MKSKTLNTNLISAGVKTQIQDLMHRLNAPNLTKDQYSQIRYEFVALNEGVYNQIYDDLTGKVLTNPSQAKGNVTIGVGFNMDRGQEARKEWNAVFGNSISFDDAYNNRVQLTDYQVRKLCDFAFSTRELEVSRIYKNVNLTPSQRLAIEDMHFNGPKLVKEGTNFKEAITDFVNTGDKKYLNKALKQVLENSNSKNDTGMSNRRLKEAAILSGNADIKLPDSEVRQLFEANKNKFDVKIDGKPAKEYFNNQIKNNGLSSNNYLNDNDKFFTSDDPSLLYKLAYNSSGPIRSDALSPLEEAIIRIKDSEGKEFSLIKDVWIPLKDGTIATIESVIETIDTASQLTTNFVNSYINEAKDLFTTGDGIASLISVLVCLKNRIINSQI